MESIQSRDKPRLQALFAEDGSGGYIYLQEGVGAACSKRLRIKWRKRMAPALSFWSRTSAMGAGA